jgi:hypothetical protein
MKSWTSVLGGCCSDSNEHHLLLSPGAGRVDNHGNDLANDSSMSLDHADLPGGLDRSYAAISSVALDHHGEGGSE